MAETILDALEAQHRAVEKVVAEVNAALAAKNARVIAERLVAMRKLLDGHFALESEQFYPRITELAEQQPATLQLAQLFQTNMNTIAEGLAAFFDRHGKGALDLATFESEWKTTLQTLGARIKQEEETLHPMYRRLERRAWR